jgi:hypothetical protein
MRLAPVIRWSDRGVAGLLLAALVVAGPASAGGGNAAVMPPSSNPHGHSYAEWSAMHWQWLYSMPVDKNPVFDTADCSEGQSGKVWFLGGTFALTVVEPGVNLGLVERDCTIPPGTSLFFRSSTTRRRPSRATGRRRPICATSSGSSATSSTRTACSARSTGSPCGT